MEHNHFGWRLGYLVWLRHLVDGRPPRNTQIGRATDRESSTVGDWFGMENFPNQRGLDAALSRYFGAPAEWIADGVGEAPQPDLWKIWVKMRRVRHAAADHTDALTAAKGQRRKRG